MKSTSRLDWKYILIALALAAITYAYLNRMIQKTAESQDSSYKLIKLTAKTVPVHVRVASSAPAGYRIIDQRITVEPARVTVVGPEALLEDTSVAETAIIDVGQATHKIIKSIPLESIAGVHLGGEPMFVDVTIPIEKLEEAR